MSTSLSWTFFPGRAPRTAQIEKKGINRKQKIIINSNESIDFVSE